MTSDSLQAKRYGAVDNLTYAYAGNRLQAVDDAVTGTQLPQPATYHGAPTSLAGDFQEAGVRLGQEYLYDANGNLTQDRNKGLTGIAYNHLNLPRQLHFGQVGDSIVFRYAAGGQKVAKLVYQRGQPVQRTDYLGPYQYEQDSLRFFPHAEGRVLRFVSYDPAGQASVGYQREYTVKDHLGNLRLAYRLGQARTYAATLEQDAATRQRETQQFDSLSVSLPVARNVGMSLARTGSYAAVLNAGGSSPQPIGPLTQLTVQQGDTLRVSAPGRYQQAVQNHGFAFSLASFVAGLLQPAPQGAPASADGRRGGLPLLQVGLNAGSLAALTQKSNGVPKGYLRVLVFNTDSVLVAQRTVQLSAAALNNYEVLQTGFLPIGQDGYVSVYVGNESAVDVLFDDVQVEYRQGLLVQQVQYDPAGLELAGLAPPSPGIRGLNNYRFNGKEFQADLGLNWNHQDWRFFDPQLLRWHAGDPEIENGQESWTPYSFGYDNAVRYADADGRCPNGCPPTKSVESEYFRGIIGGIGSGLVNLATSLENALDHPFTTATSLIQSSVQSVLHPINTQRSIQNQVKTGVVRALSGNPRASGAVLGGAIVVGATMLVAPEAEAETVALDANALIAAVEYGEKEAVLTAAAGRQLTTSTTAVKEFLKRGSKADLRSFMKQNGVRMAQGATEEEAAAMQAEGKRHGTRQSPQGREIKPGDARVTASAKKNGSTLLTRDRVTRNFMNDRRTGGKAQSY